MIFITPAPLQKIFEALRAFILIVMSLTYITATIYKGERAAISIALFLCIKVAENPISCRLEQRVVGARREGADAEQQRATRVTHF